METEYIDESLEVIEDENDTENEILDVSEDIQDELLSVEETNGLGADSENTALLREIRDMLADSVNSDGIVEVSIFDKPLEQYTVSESLGLLIFILLLWLVISRQIGGVFR